MKREEVPVGFGNALMRNEEATNAFAMMTQEQKQEIWSRARQAKSRAEMQGIVNSMLSQKT